MPRAFHLLLSAAALAGAVNFNEQYSRQELDRHTVHSENIFPNRGQSRRTYASSEMSNRPKIRCYTCMSRFYELHWQSAKLSKVFRRPQDFTDACQDPAGSPEVTYQDCTNPCVTLTQTYNFMGNFKAYIRGCWDSTLYFGINRSLPLYRYDMCANLSYIDLSSSYSRRDNDHASLHFFTCSCRADLCNAAPRVRHRELLAGGSIAPVASFVLAVLSATLFLRP